MHISRLKKASGFTLIELLIAVTINIILISALLSVFANNLSNYNTVIQVDTLSQQMQLAMNLMANDIRRAGYWSLAATDVNSGANNNPYMTTATDLTVNGSCILFAYDYNKNGTLPAIGATGDDERYGYRLSGNAIQTRPPGAAFSCSAGATAWENVTNPNIVNITALTFTETTKTVPPGASSSSILIRSVDISMTGQLVSNANVTKTITQHVRVANSKFVP